MRIGIGYDVHRLVSDRKLILGGVEIPYDKGLLGHSDADVLCHSIGDAILGAGNLGDLGKHFPPSDNKYKDISSLILLEKINELINQANFKIKYIDSIVVCEKPKLAPYIIKMRENIAKALNISINQISVKATTTEGLGFEGIGDGISSYAIVTLEEPI